MNWWPPIGVLLAVVQCAVAQPGDARRGLGADLSRESAQLSETSRDETADQAARAYREGRLEDSLRGFDRAAAAAYKAGAKGTAFEHALVAAEIQRARGQWQDASERFRRAALSSVNDPRSVAAHFEACKSAGEAVRRGAADRQQLEQYDQLLAEHTQNWPDTPTSAEASWLRFELLGPLGRWEQVAEVARTASPTHPRRERAMQLLVEAHEELLKVANPASYGERLDRATNDLQPLVVGSSGRWPGAWSPLQRRVALVLGRGHLQRAEGGAEYATLMLGLALRGDPPADARWRLDAVPLLVVGELVQGNTQGAYEWLTMALDTDAATAQGVLASVQSKLDSAGPTDRIAIAMHLRQMIAALAPTSPETPVATDEQGLRARAEALAASGDHRSAIGLYDQLIAESPNDRSLRLAQAGAMERAEAHESALAAWRQIEARTPRNTPGWYEARLARIRLLVTLRRSDEAHKLLRMTKLTAPDLGGESTRARFLSYEEILEEQKKNPGP